MQRTFTPDIISTKENLLTALRTGDIKSSKYNLLNEEEKLFVELIVFGDYNAEQAMMSIRGSNYHKGMGNRMCARPGVADALEELSYKKNKKFMAEVTTSRDMALRKLMYIMNTTEDEGVAVLFSLIKTAVIGVSFSVYPADNAKDTGSRYVPGPYPPTSIDATS